jgi:predicted nucleic acid-binding Zn finger protein
MTKLYCACGDFYYRVLGSKITECYHLLALKFALEEELFVVVNFSDDELPGFLRALVSDDFKQITSASPRAAREEPLP